MLSLSERYVADQSLVVYNQILFTRFYNLIWKGHPIMAAWDVKNKLLVSVMFSDLNNDEMLELEDIISQNESTETEQLKTSSDKRVEKIRKENMRKKLILDEKLRKDQQK
jgi:hypothetical protein